MRKHGSDGCLIARIHCVHTAAPDIAGVSRPNDFPVGQKVRHVYADHAGEFWRINRNAAYDSLMSEQLNHSP